MNSTVVGQGAEVLAFAENGTAVGQGAVVESETIDGTAIGRDSYAAASYATALGANASVYKDNGTAVGDRADVNGLYGTAIGADSSAAFDNSTAIGYGAKTLFANQFMFGTSSNTYTMPGIVSDASRAAQTGDLEFVMTDINGNLASDGGTFAARLAAAEQQIADTQEILSTPIELDPLDVALTPADTVKLSEPDSATTPTNNPVTNATSVPTGGPITAATSSGSDALDSLADGINANVAAINTNVDAINTNATAINTNVAAINQNATAISTVSSVANSNQTRIANVESSLVDNSLAITQLNTQFERIGLQVDELATIVADNTEQIAANTAGIAIANAMAGTSGCRPMRPMPSRPIGGIMTIPMPSLSRRHSGSTRTGRPIWALASRRMKARLALAPVSVTAGSAQSTTAKQQKAALEGGAAFLVLRYET